MAGRFYAGEGAQPAALAALLQAGIEAETQAGRTQLAGVGQGVQSALGGIENGLALYFRAKEQAAERQQRDRLFQRQLAADEARQRNYQAFQSEENDLARQAAEDRMEAEQRFQSGRDLFGAGQDYIRQGRDIEARRELALLAQQEAQRAALEKQRAEAAQKKLMDDAMLAATQYEQSPEGQKALYMEFEPTGLDALGLTNLPQSAVEALVISRFPDTRPLPVVGEGKVADRTALDAKLKELKQKFYVQVPNEIVFQQRLGEMVSLYGSEAALAAMKEIRPPYATAGARGPRSGWEMAKQHVLEILGLTKDAGNSPQVQGGLSDILGAVQEQQQASEALAPPQEARLTTGFLEAIGAQQDQLPVALRGAAALEMPLAVEGERIVLQPDTLKDPSGPIPPPKGAQEELDKFFERNPRLKTQALALLGTPEQRRTPSEVRDMGARRALQRDREPAPKLGPEAPRTDGEAQAPPTGGMAALEAYRARVRNQLKPSKKAQPELPMPPSRRVPLNMSLVGRDLGELARLLAGAGGPR